LLQHESEQQSLLPQQAGALVQQELPQLVAHGSPQAGAQLVVGQLVSQQLVVGQQLEVQQVGAQQVLTHCHRVRPGLQYDSQTHSPHFFCTVL